MKSMVESAVMSGVLSPIIMPFMSDLAPDKERLVRQGKWLLSQDCGLAVFGTNSEANSLSVAEKAGILDALVEGGIDAARMMPGTGACAIPDAVELTAQAVNHGCGGVLMLPPFFYKGVSDEGLYRYYAEVIERVGDARLRVYLYHIPPVAQVPIPIDLIERLVKDYPDTVVGLKDSGGDWSYSETLLKNFPGFGVFAGNETLLLQTMQAGGVGCISATANINAAAIHQLYAAWQEPDARQKQDALNGLRNLMQSYPMIPALKAVVAHYSGDPEWFRVRPPLVELDADKRSSLLAELGERGFDMPGLA